MQKNKRNKNIIKQIKNINSLKIAYYKKKKLRVPAYYFSSIPMKEIVNY